jgi:hypothetical protein
MNRPLGPSAARTFLSVYINRYREIKRERETEVRDRDRDRQTKRQRKTDIQTD